METPIEKAVRIAGNQSALARAVNVSPQAVQQWVESGRVSHKKVIDVERATGVSRSELRPDLYPDERIPRYAMEEKTGTADEIFQAAFSKPRDERSKEYKQGVLDVLRFRLNEIGKIRHTYIMGTASADAYYAGCDEGHRLAREYFESLGDAEFRTTHNA